MDSEATMIDFTLFGCTLALLLVGVWYACSTSNVGGEDVIEDDGRGQPPPVRKVVRWSRRSARRRGGREH
ncbi:hypothetical protein KF840_01325 [bacterium]|nr:hypothetical protein [bacterium]